MLRVTIEDWPFGHEDQKTVLGYMDIVNDGTGTLDIGNYYVRVNGDKPHSSRVSQYYAGSHKRELGWWPLVVQSFMWAGEKIPHG